MTGAATEPAAEPAAEPADRAGGGPSLVIDLPTAADTRALGRRLASLTRAGDLLILSGDLGAGKTTLVQGLGEGLGVRGRVSSPTFVIARHHPPAGARPGLLHVDAYRLESLSQLDDLDLDAELEDVVTAVEWGSGLAERLAADRLEIRIDRPRGTGAAPADGLAGEDVQFDEARRAELRGAGPRWRGLGDWAPGPA